MSYADFSKCLKGKTLADIAKDAGLIVQDGNITGIKGSNETITEGNSLSDISNAISNALNSNSSPSSDTLSGLMDSIMSALGNIDSDALINAAINSSSFKISTPSSMVLKTNSSLGTTGQIEGVFFKNINPIMPSLANTESAEDAHYSTRENYPNSAGTIDALGNFIKINKKTGQVDIVHFSGTLIQITKSGTVNIQTKKDFRHIVKGNYYLEVKGDIGIKSKNLNIVNDNMKEITKKTRYLSTKTFVQKVKTARYKIKALKEDIKTGVYKIKTFMQKSKALIVKVPEFVIKGNEKVSGRRH